MLICFLEWLYHFTFPLAVYETSSFCPSSPAFGGVTLSHLSDNFFYFSHSDSVWWYLIVCVCVFLITLFIYLFWLCWVFVAVQAFLWLQWAGFSLQSGFSYCGARTRGAQASVVVVPELWSTGSAVVAQGLSCSEARGTFLDQGSDLSLLHWQVDSLPLSHRGSPYCGFNLHFLSG